MKKLWPFTYRNWSVERIINYFVTGSITEQQTSHYSGLDSTKKVNLLIISK